MGNFRKFPVAFLISFLNLDLCKQIFYVIIAYYGFSMRNIRINKGENTCQKKRRQKS